MIQNNVKDLSAEEAKAILAGIPPIRVAADEYDWEAAKKDPSIRYAFNSAAEKFGYDVWNYLVKKGVASYVQQEVLPLN